jgi:hypothetical protein
MQASSNCITSSSTWSRFQNPNMGKYEGCGKGRVQRLQQTESENEKERVYLLDASIRAEGRSPVRVEVQRLRQGHWRGSPQRVDAF